MFLVENSVETYVCMIETFAGNLGYVQIHDNLVYFETSKYFEMQLVHIIIY